jgi:Transposase DDE domain
MRFTARQAPTKRESFLDCLRYFLTPQVWKQVQGSFRACNAIRWHPQPLIYVLLVMTWCCGDSSPERFETAKAFYSACYQRKRRPGKTIEGFQKALARVPTAVLRAVASAIRCRLAQIFSERFTVDGFVPLGCDGSTLACPRSAELQKRLGGNNNDDAPQVWVTALVHLSLGLLWSWRLGKGGTASERDHLRQLLASLPRLALLVADAGYPGYDLLQTLVTARVSFLMRLSSRAPLYAPERVALSRFREGLVYYWPQEAQRKKLQPIAVRLLRVRGRKVDVWLITNVFAAEQLSHKTASTFYRWRWRNEGLFRTYKRTLGKVKLMSRTIALVHREAEGSLLAVQLLLAQGSLALQFADEVTILLPSARKILLAIRGEIRNVTGMYLGPRQRQSYLHRLQQARGDARQRRHNKVRQPWPGRRDHKPPGPPKILTMGTDLKQLLASTLGVA